MELSTAYRDVNSGALFFSWENAPVTTVVFQIALSFDSPVEGDNWQLLTTTTNPFVSDLMSKRSSRFFDEKYYRVRALDSSNTVVDELIIPDTPKNHRPIVDATKNLLMHAAEIVIGNSSWSYDAYLIKPRRTGIVCSCHQEELRSSTDPDCKQCYGTGYVGGFYQPIPTRVKVHAEQINVVQANAPIPVQTNTVQLVVPTIVKLFAKDYIIIPDLGYRFICLTTNIDSLVTEKTATQMVNVSRLDRGDNFYKYPIDTAGVHVDEVTYDATTVTVTGKNLYPLFGRVKLVFGKKVTDELDALVLTQYDLTLVSGDKLVFEQSDPNPLDLETDLSEYNYMLFLNLRRTHGTAVHS